MSAECPRHPACGCAPASPDPCICPLTPAGEALLASGLMQADHPDAHELVPCQEGGSHIHTKELPTDFDGNTRLDDLPNTVHHVYRSKRRWHGSVTVYDVSASECSRASERYGEVFEITVP